MKRIFAIIILSVLLLSFTVGCNTKESNNLATEYTPKKINDTQLTEVSNTEVTDFAIRLFKASVEKDGSTLVSPLSVLSALAMTANGADGETLAQMEAVLGMPVSELNGWISTYVNKLPESDKYKLNLANSIWFTDDSRFTVNGDFLQTNADYYGAGIYRAEFNNATCREINRWVHDKTDGMIDDIVDELSPYAVMYLVNALAFEAEWQEIYEKNQVRSGSFTELDGERERADFMYSTESSYLEDASATGFIKYYKDREYAFVALLPNENVQIFEYIETLTGEHIAALLKNASSEPVSVAIPKFEEDYDADMSLILSKMGMTDAFSEDRADFSRLGESTAGNIFINRVLHETYIRVDEKGTKAGAATVVEMTDGASAEVVDPKYVYLDRPFVYMLIDSENGIPFFIGTVLEVD